MAQAQPGEGVTEKIVIVQGGLLPVFRVEDFSERSVINRHPAGEQSGHLRSRHGGPLLKQQGSGNGDQRRGEQHLDLRDKELFHSSLLDRIKGWFLPPVLFVVKRTEGRNQPRLLWGWLCKRTFPLTGRAKRF